MNTVGSIVAKLVLNIENFSSNLSKIQNDIQQTGKKLEGLNNFGVGLTKAGSTLTKSLTVPIVGVGVAAATTAANFEAAMSKVEAISSATGDEMKLLEDKAKEMGATTKFSAVESAEAFKYMAMAGWKSGQIIDGISGIMSLAAADGLDLATTSDIVTDAITAFGLKAEDSSHFADVLAKASSNANTNVSMLGESFKYAAPVMGAMKYSVEDTAVALGIMANSGIKAGQAGTTLRTMITSIAKPTKKSKEMLDEYSLTLTKGNGEMKSLSEVIDMLRSKLGGLTEAEQAKTVAQIFGKEAMSGTLAVINATNEDYQKLTDSIAGADGAAKKMADTMLDNLNGQLTILKSALEGLAIEIGQMLLPTIKKIVSKIQEFVTWLQSLSQEQKEQIVKWAGIIAAIGPVLLIFGKLITTIVSLGKIFTGLKGAAILAKGGLVKLGGIIAGLSAPVLAVIAVVAGLVAGFIYLWNTNEEFRNSMKEIWEDIKAAVVPIVQSIWEGLKELWEILKPIVEYLLNTLAPVIEAVFKTIGEVIQGVLKVINGIIDFVVGVFTGDWDRAWSGIKQIFEGIMQQVIGIFTGAWDAIKGFFLSFWDPFFQLLRLSWEGVKTFLTELWTNIKQGAIDGWENLKSSILGKIEKTKVETKAKWFAFKVMMQNVMNDIKEKVTEIWEGVKNFFSNTWDSIKDKFNSTISGITSFVEEHFGGLLENLRNIFDNIKEVFENAWTIIKNVVGGIILSIIDLITGDFDQLKSDIVNVGQNIGESFKAIGESVKEIFINAGEAIKNYLSETWTLIKETASQSWEGFKTTLRVALQEIKDNFMQMWSNLGMWFGDKINGIKENAINIWNALKESFSNIGKNMGDNIKQIWENIKSFFTNNVNEMKNKGTESFRTMGSSIRNSVNDIKGNIVRGFNDAVAFIKSLPSEAGKWGSDIIYGIVDGIKRAAHAVGDAVRGVAQDIRAYLHFSVPDKGPLTDFETYMPDMIDGLASTLQNAAPRLYKAAETVAGGLSNTFGSQDLQIAMAGAYGDTIGGIVPSSNQSNAVRSMGGGGTITIEKIEVRNDKDIETLTRGLYDHNDKSLRAMGRRNL